MRIYDTLGRTDVAWTATSDSPWLSVTGSGMTGHDITLTADPTGLTPDATQFATVTVKSSDRTVENQQQIRVGLNIRSTASSALSVTATAVAASSTEGSPSRGMAPGSSRCRRARLRSTLHKKLAFSRYRRSRDLVLRSLAMRRKRGYPELPLGE